MTHRDFVYFLQGHMEINDPKTISKEHLDIIKEHLRCVLERSKQSEKDRPEKSSPFGNIQGFSTLDNQTLFC